MATLPHRKGNRKSMADELSKEMDLLLKNTFDKKRTKKSKKNKNSHSTSSSNASKSHNSKDNHAKPVTNDLSVDYSDNQNRYISSELNEEYPYLKHQENELNPFKTEPQYFTDNTPIYNDNNNNNNNNIPNSYSGRFEGGDYSISSNYYPYSNIPIQPEDDYYYKENNNNSNNNDNNVVKDDNYLVDERPSRPLSRWSDSPNQDIHQRSHSLNSHKKKHKHRKNRNRSFSPQVSSCLNDHLPNIGVRRSSLPPYKFNNNSGLHSPLYINENRHSSSSLGSVTPLINDQKKKNRQTTIYSSPSVFDNFPKDRLPYPSTNFDELNFDNNNDNYLPLESQESNPIYDSQEYPYDNYINDIDNNTSNNYNMKPLINHANNYENNSPYNSDGHYNDDNQVSGLIVESFSIPNSSPNVRNILDPVTPITNGNNVYNNVNSNPSHNNYSYQTIPDVYNNVNNNPNQNHYSYQTPPGVYNNVNNSQNQDNSTYQTPSDVYANTNNNQNQNHNSYQTPPNSNGANSYRNSVDIVTYQDNDYYQGDFSDQELTEKYNTSQIKKSKKKRHNRNKHISYKNDSRIIEEGRSPGSSSEIRRKRSLVRPERSRRRNKYMNYAIENSNYVMLEHSFEENDEPYPVYPFSPGSETNYDLKNYTYNDNCDRSRMMTEEEKLKRQSNIFVKKNAIDPDFGRSEEDDDNSFDKNESFKKIWWSMVANACTFYIPNVLLERFNKTDPGVQQAWREKVTLCTIILIICIISGFFTFGLGNIVCNSSTAKVHYSDISYAVHGVAYDIYIRNFNETKRLHSIISASKNYDMGPYFKETNSKSACQKISSYSDNKCSSKTIDRLLMKMHQDDKKCYQMKDLLKNPEIQVRELGNVYYTWNDLKNLNENKNRKLIVYNGNVLDITDYISNGEYIFGNKFTEEIRNKSTRDITYTVSKNKKFKNAAKCMNEIYKVGTIGKNTSGCIVSRIILVLTFVFVIGVIFIKFCMALVFNWFLKWQMGDRSGFIKKIAEEERRISKMQEVKDLANGININEKRHILRDSMSITTLINSSANKRKSISIFDEKGRRNSTGQLFSLNSDDINSDDKKSTKQQNRKSMTSRFSIPMPGEGSRTNLSNSNSNFTLPNYPNPFKMDGIKSSCSLNELTKPKRNSISSWDPNSPLTASQSLLNTNSNKRKSIFSTMSTPSLDSIFKNTQAHSSPLLTSTIPSSDITSKGLPEPTLPDVGILDEEMAPTITNSPAATNKRVSILPNSTINDKRISTVGLSTTSAIESEGSVPIGGRLTADSTIKDLLHTILLVTCYSEGHDGIANSLDSLSNTDYPDSLKLIIVICDGLVKGEGNDQLTPDIVIDMIDPGDGSNYHDDEPEPKSYVAIAEGKKRHNMAKIYAGWYRYVYNAYGRKIPMIGIVKCGTGSERFGPEKSPKPGNRGKRDSQILLLGFLSRVMFNDRMTEFDFELFTKIHELTGVFADVYESIMMVDADTIVDKDSLSHLVACLIEDPKIMGLCGETQIANKTESWVTMIQVFEYYISHHMSKAFESVFGGVTCLPGCFCMYRIKSRKGSHGYWVPILANPEIVEQYSENVVDTLHKKNLLLLGEDRYLSTLMLREFPRRKMVFVPQATCQTIVPSEFKVLLSQRRRWINSTVHNLLELVLVNDLCGTFCISMQFVVLMELIGTVVLPAAIFFTYYLIGSVIFSSNKNVMTLILMLLVMALPAILIGLTSREMKYILWMLVYLLALPVWNFILPIYSFWHFDDFSWGQTRMVEGESSNKKGDHGSEGEFDSSGIIMKTWEEWEKIRRAEILANEFYLQSTEKNEGDMGNFSTLYNEVQPSQINTNNKRFTGSFNNITLNNRNSYYQGYEE